MGPAAGPPEGQWAGHPAGPAAGRLAGLARVRGAGSAGSGAIFGLSGRGERAPILLRYRTYMPGSPGRVGVRAGTRSRPASPWGAADRAIQAGARSPRRVIGFAWREAPDSCYDEGA